MGRYLVGYPEKNYPRLTHFGFSDEPREFDSGMHRHVGYEFVFFYNGASAVQVTENSSPVHLSGDDLLIMPPFVPHKFATPPEPLHYCWFGFQAGNRIAKSTDKMMFPADVELDKLPPEELSFTEDFDPKIDEITGNLHISDIAVIPNTPELRLPFQQIMKEILVPKPFSSELIHVKILEILTLLLRRLYTATFNLFDLAADYIRSHCSEKLTLAKIAGKIGYDSSYFSRKFTQTFGISPINFLRKCRIEKAKLLIAEGKPLFSAAEECGFSSVHYFNRVFREEVGITPGQFFRSCLRNS
jgi:AraC-like DNA-binding protein